VTCDSELCDTGSILSRQCDSEGGYWDSSHDCRQHHIPHTQTYTCYLILHAHYHILLVVSQHATSDLQAWQKILPTLLFFVHFTIWYSMIREQQCPMPNIHIHEAWNNRASWNLHSVDTARLQSHKMEPLGLHSYIHLTFIVRTFKLLAALHGWTLNDPKSLNLQTFRKKPAYFPFYATQKYDQKRIWKTIKFSTYTQKSKFYKWKLTVIILS
jgi:hypothetical protein